MDPAVEADEVRQLEIGNGQAPRFYFGEFHLAEASSGFAQARKALMNGSVQPPVD
jgi:hypothetical protein